MKQKGGNIMKKKLSMPLRKLGSSELNVSAIGFGGMPISLNTRPSEAEGMATIHAALEQGITLIDTADAYCLDSSETGHNERLIAKALKNRSDIYVATKGGVVRPEGRWEPDGSPKHLRQACEDSLRALGVDTITLYQLHCPDPKIPWAESLGMLSDLQREGKITHLGLSNVNVDQLEAALKIIHVVSVQNRMNLFDRSSMDVLKQCEARGIAFIPFSPLNGAAQAGKIGNNGTVARIANKHEVSAQQIALAWLLHISPMTIPIPGTRRISNIIDCAQAVLLTLSPEESLRLSF